MHCLEDSLLQATWFQSSIVFDLLYTCTLSISSTACWVIWFKIFIVFELSYNSAHLWLLFLFFFGQLKIIFSVSLIEWSKLNILWFVHCYSHMKVIVLSFIFTWKASFNTILDLLWRFTETELESCNKKWVYIYQVFSVSNKPGHLELGSMVFKC